MTLEEITAGIEARHQEWATAHIEDLDKVTENDAIKARIIHFAEESIRHPKALTGNPSESARVALKLTGLSNFRLGLLVGLLLWQGKNKQPPRRDLSGEMPSDRCEHCDGTGHVCHECGVSHYDCACGMGKYSPVKCAACEGQGWVGQ